MQSQQDITSKNLLSQLEKGETHIEWVEVHRANGTTFKRRQKKANQQDKHEVDTHKFGSKFGGDSSNSAALKDAIVHAHHYKGELYDSKGEKLDLPPAIKQEAIKNKTAPYNEISDKSHKEKLKATHKHFTENVLPLIEKKDEMLKHEEKKQKKTHDDLWGLEGVKNSIARSIGDINKQSTYDELLKMAHNVSSKLDVIPDIAITRNGKRTVLNLTNLELSLSKEIDKMKSNNMAFKVHQPANVDKVEFIGLDDLQQEDLKQVPFKLNHKDAYNSINKKIEKEKGKKAQMDETK